MKHAIKIATGTALAALLLLPGMAVAQDKAAKCSEVKITVDMKVGKQWKDGVATLGLTEKGGGWTIVEPYQRSGETIDAIAGTELRFTFMAGGYPIDVKATYGGAQAITLEEQNQPHIVRVKTNKPTKNAASFAFEITGAKNPKAKINGCPGGSVSIIVE